MAPATTTGADGWISGGGFVREDHQAAAIAFTLSCDDDRRPARLELLWRVPGNRDPRDRNDRRPDWDWDDQHWNGRSWNMHDWNDRDWDNYEWDDRDWYNWGRDRRERRRRDNDPDERRGGWGRFHLTNVTSATCTNDPAIGSNGRNATFDTHTGTGRGRLADGSPATIEWTLVDGGEPGRRDRVSVKVRNDRGQVLFQVSDSLSAGRIKAHRR